eukprot:TRINITY_DN17075_c0_g1_i2.p1 TRINITY_DN17075_c0_g1~~TRINITY_DN17075_c0_g1_i2.p1  ORF type:complete len:312 (+),score=86.52 TRINITY_DN17075_c0_g1_i2:103-936(+)
MAAASWAPRSDELLLQKAFAACAAGDDGASTCDGVSSDDDDASQHRQSSPSSSTASADAAADDATLDDSCGELGEEGAADGASQARCAEVVRLELEAMNAAAESLNAAQVAHSACARRRSKLEETWAAESVRFVVSIGKDRLSRVLPFFECCQRSLAAEEAAREASERYALAAAGGAPASQGSLDTLEAEHLRRLRLYREAQRSEEAARRQLSASPAALEAVRPYFAAEAKHRAELEAVASEMKGLVLKLDDAKARYGQALARLESLSEEMHNRRRR